MIHWQNIVVALILVSTGIYIGGRVWSRIRSLVRTEAANESSCAGGGCAGCGSPAAMDQLTRSPITRKGKRLTLHRLKWRY
jgi:hypothetical protein